jgi:hypothetical protein
VGIPERLTTIRLYDSPELAAADHQMLLDAGIDAYLGGSYYRHRERAQLRVPESQIDRALELLPPELELPTLHDDLRLPSIRCVRCESAAVNVVAPAANYFLVGGVLLGVWALARRQVNAAVLMMIAMTVFAAFAKKLSARRRCDRCGHVWRHGSTRFRPAVLHASTDEDRDRTDDDRDRTDGDRDRTDPRQRDRT